MFRQIIDTAWGGGDDVEPGPAGWGFLFSYLHERWNIVRKSDELPKRFSTVMRDLFSINTIFIASALPSAIKQTRRLNKLRSPSESAFNYSHLFIQLASSRAVGMDDVASRLELIALQSVIGSGK